jgi:AbrB family looped-hinge helix DNA binding protein
LTPRICGILGFCNIEVKKEKIMRITSKGQVTIPQTIREKMALFPNTEVEFNISGDKVFITKVRSRKGRGSEIVARLRGKATVHMTTDQIMALTRG